MKEIELSKQGKYKGKFVAIVDDEDYEWLSQYRWFVANPKNGNTQYCTTFINNKQKRMHRMILPVPKNMVIDHVNHNGLDNRRSNLRICTNKENLRNSCKQKHTSTSYKGVYYNKSQNKYCPSISDNNTRLRLGQFNNEISAAVMYDLLALQRFKEFAWLNIKDKSILKDEVSKFLEDAKLFKDNLLYHNISLKDIFDYNLVCIFNNYNINDPKNIGIDDLFNKAVVDWSNHYKENKVFNFNKTYYESIPIINYSPSTYKKNYYKRTDNSSFYKGVTFEKKYNIYKTRLFINNKLLGQSYFKNEISAAVAYDLIAIKYKGESARPNITDFDFLKSQKQYLIEDAANLRTFIINHNFNINLILKYGLNVLFDNNEQDYYNLTDNFENFGVFDLFSNIVNN